MPFDSKNPPEKIRKLSDKKQRQWVAVFNSCYDKHHDDEKCHKMAWGAVKTACMRERVACIVERMVGDA